MGFLRTLYNMKALLSLKKNYNFMLLVENVLDKRVKFSIKLHSQCLQAYPRTCFAFWNAYICSHHGQICSLNLG